MIKLIPVVSVKGFRSSEHLDLIRGISAWAVCIGHLRNLFFVDYESINNKNIFIKILYLITGFGHEAVVVFFILSGFFISASVLRSISENRWNWSNYLLVRLARLYVVLIPALLLTVFFDLLGMYFSNAGGIYSGQSLMGNIVNFNVADRLTINNFLANLLFLQRIFSPTFGSNSPLWSLSYEFWYYMIFPLLVLSFASQKKKVKAFSLIATLFLLWMVGEIISIYFLIWLGGAFLHFSSKFQLKGNLKYIALGVSGIVFLAVLGAVRLKLLPGSEVLSDFVLAIFFGFFLYAILQDRSRNTSELYKKVSHKIAGFSYTLYLVHLPLLVFCNSLLLKDQRWQPEAFNLSIGLGIFVFVIIYAYLISLVTEAQTEKVRSKLAKRLNIK